MSTAMGSCLLLELTLAVPSATDIVCLRYLQTLTHRHLLNNSEVSHTTGNGKLNNQTRKAFKTMKTNLSLGDKAAIRRQQQNCAGRHRDAGVDLSAG